MSRKTIQVSALTDFVNNFTKKSGRTSDDRQRRQGMIIMMNHILHETGNYQGYRHLLKEEVPAGAFPGVNYENGQLPPYEERFVNTDDTRIMFF